MTTIIKLDSNENPFGPSPHAIKAMQAVLAGCSDYPDDDASTLRLKLAEHHGVLVEQILVTGGLTEFLGMLARAFLAPGLNAVTSQRSFIVYRLATEAAGRPVDRSAHAPGRIRSLRNCRGSEPQYQASLSGESE